MVIVTGFSLDDRRDQILSASKVKNVLFSTSSRPVLKLIQPLFQRVLRALSLGVK
jgi:hypothetical protein